MKIDVIVRDVFQSVQAIIRGLDNQLTASENFAPEGIVGQVLTSTGTNTPPEYKTPTVENRTTDPASPAVGQMWYRTDTNELKIQSITGIKVVTLT